ncbi:hypothetical protein OYC64_018013 [Pagothenia borchgrevinki]|uniref:Uncharacterized protein n=1 Tax=Pagothenia borchgrevinki TaxID=8213 RepID=A0ABD2GNG8_PAGBO
MEEQRPRLETIGEESWQEDETEGSKSGEEEEEDFQIQVDTKEVMVDEESEEDEGELRVQRPMRLFGSLRQASYLQNQSTNKDQEEMENSSDLDRSTQALDLCDEATTQPKRFGNEKWSISKLLRIEVSKVKWPKHTPPKQSVQKKRTRKRVKKVSKAEQRFPKWLVDLMINIEEATTHQLVVE